MLFSAASFSESFYGLKRIAVVDSKFKSNLSNKQQLLSLILIAAFPYLKNKLTQLSLRYKFEEIDSYASEEASSIYNSISYF
jgi:hypothetical protein